MVYDKQDDMNLCEIFLRISTGDHRFVALSSAINAEKNQTHCIYGYFRRCLTDLTRDYHRSNQLNFKNVI